MASHVLVYYTHFVSNPVKRELSRLRDELPESFDCWATGCCNHSSVLDDLGSDRVSVRAYVRAEIGTLSYPERMASVDWNTMRGSPDLTLLRFFLDHPCYDYYWFLEYDVRFTGQWRALFEDLLPSEADLLCAHITELPQDPNWVHWDSFSSGRETVLPGEQIRAFLPLCRASRRLLEAVDERCQQGWAGHPEVLWPTVARVAGFRIEEIGGSSQFTPANRKNSYYFSARIGSRGFLSTFGAWPFYSEKSNFQQGLQTEGVLWHPVKE
jgi:Protein of unknown function (DUF3405)